MTVQLPFEGRFKNAVKVIHFAGKSRAIFRAGLQSIIAAPLLKSTAVTSVPQLSVMERVEIERDLTFFDFDKLSIATEKDVELFRL